MTKRPSRGVTSGIGPPTKMDGRDGDLTIRKTRDGKILYVKEHGAWHPINTGIDIAALKKDVDRLSRNFQSSQNDYNFHPTLTEVNFKKYSDGTGFKIKNDSGVMKVRNLADNADGIIKAKRLQVDAGTGGTTGAVVGECQYNSSANSFVNHGQGFLIDAATTGSSGDIGILAVASHTADSVLKFFDESTIKWTMGYDHTDGGVATGKFKIHNATTLADTSKLMLDTGGNLVVAGTVTSSAGELGVGDITGVTLTGDSGGALADTSGSADFTIAGGTNCATAGSGSTITVNVDDAFLKNNAADIMAVSDFGAAAALKIDADQPATAGAEDSVGLHIDYDRIVAGSGTAAHNDIGIDLDVNTASLGTSTVKGIDIDVVGATSGTHTATGLDISVSGADKNHGLDITVPDGSDDYHIKLMAADDASNDYATLAVADTGDLTIATTGDGARDSDIILDAEGMIKLESAANGVFIAEANGSGVDLSAYGQLWVKDNAPNELCFTDDTGTDIVGIGKYSYDVRSVGYNGGATGNYLPINGYVIEKTATASNNEFIGFVAPYNGTLEKLLWRTEIAQTGTVSIRILESADGTEVPGTISFRKDFDYSGLGSGINDDTTVDADLTSPTTGDTTLDKGKIYAFYISHGNIPYDTNVTLVFKWDITS